ncbi:hypothetical protein CEP51_004628 [Fusarium floridanum]|uniref:Uncharacterized protein n=1 Tax=Fusarium floridanum TaxID=1325733 RepID=A0A428S0H0_9HYPO|nr:hypothetical protein CEP51_004628 [Fusarium floridanum]
MALSHLKAWIPQREQAPRVLTVVRRMSLYILNSCYQIPVFQTGIVEAILQMTPYKNHFHFANPLNPMYPFQGTM